MAEGPLSGIRVLDFTWAWAGPFCTMQLAHLGAEVIRIETTARPACVTRLIPPFADDIPGPNRAGYFNQYNLGKKSMLMNLARPEAIEIACEMVRHCDIVADNFAAGVMDKLGLGYDKLRRFRDDLIMISMSGYGQTGPFKGFIGYGPPASAAAGMFFTTGYRGMGQMTGREPERQGNRDCMMAPHECYRAAGDDNWVSIAVGTEDEWRALCRAMGSPALADDPRFKTAALRKRHEDALDEMVTAWTRLHDRWEVTRMLQAAGVAAFPAMSNKDLAEDPHLLERGFLVEPEHPEIGKRKHAGIPWKMSDTPCAVRSAAPVRGAHTEEVMKALLGYTSDKVDQLCKAGILA